MLASSPPYNAYSYDQTTPQFTPDGRLLQVEYASRAPEHSGPLVVLPVMPSSTRSNNNEHDEEDDVASVIIAALAQGSQLQSDGQDREKDNENENENADDNESQTNQIKKTTRRGQSRLVSLPLGPSISSTASVPSIVVGLSGILADATSLLRTARDDLTAYRRTYGLSKLHAVLPTHTSACGGTGGVDVATSATQAAPTVVARRVARAVGDKCQTHSFGGGIRPYGASIVICGVDESGACICVTDPSGAVVARQFTADAMDYSKYIITTNKGGGKSLKADEEDGHNGNADNVIVVGGDLSVQRKLKEQVATNFSSDESSSSSSSREHVSRLRCSVDAVVKSLLETHGYLGNGSNSSSQDSSKRKALSLELLIARADGSYRLSEKQVDAIVERILLQSAKN